MQDGGGGRDQAQEIQRRGVQAKYEVEKSKTTDAGGAEFGDELKNCGESKRRSEKSK